MEITIKRSGGYAGLEEEPARLDTDRLDETERAELERLVSEAGFFDLPADVSGGVGADLMRYELTVREDGREHTVAWSEEGGVETEPLRRLAELVERLS